jgi:hypothetical protein
MAKTKEQIIQEALARKQPERFVGPVGMIPEGPMTRQAMIQAALDRKLAAAPVQQSMPSRIGQAGLGALETGMMMASGAVAEPAAGLVGFATTPFQGIGQGVQNIEATRQALTYEPRTMAGQQYTQALGGAIEPVARFASGVSERMGEAGFQAGGPVLGAIGQTALPAALELAGVKGVNLGRTVSKSDIAPDARQVLESGQARNVPVQTSDVLPPQNFATRWMQSIYDKIPVLGGASTRQTQQAARQEAVRGLADEFGLELESVGDLSVNMVNSINQQNAATLSRAGAQRLQATQVLDPLGAVPMNTTFSAIDKLLQEQASLGARADTGLIQKLTDIRDSLAVGPMVQGIQQPRNFSGVKDIRTTVIDDLKAINRSDDPRSFAQLQQVKSAMDKDMVAFARQADPQAARNWLESNRVFARELEATRRTELRRAFNAGNTTPEIVLPILRGGKRSELQRLNSALTPSGQRSARAALVYDALAESGYFADPANANPDRLANALKRQNRLQAVDVFFTGNDKEALQGFVRLLDATRRAQQAGVVTPTGQQLVPFAVGGAAFAEPVMAAISTATLSGIGRFYESAGMRNFLLKLNNTKAGSRQEMALIEAAVPALTASLKTLSEQQQTGEE